jgi:TetR/AcrR family transcriptional regulator of autoinduction and epiphytic fitness
MVFPMGTATTAGSSVTSDDGRHARRHQNRRAVLEALVELYEEGDYAPRSAAIAQRAGLSPRSLFRYYDDIDDLSRAAIDLQLRRARPLLAIAASPADPTDAKIDCLVAARIGLFEAVAPAARAARMTAPRSRLVAAQVGEARAYLRRQIEELFAPELNAMEPERAACVLGAIDVLCSFESHELLSSQQGLPREGEAATLTAALLALVGGIGRS